METFLENLAMGMNAADLQLSPDQKLAELPNWDSLAILTTLSMIDMEYGITVKGAELQQCETVADLYKLVEERKG